ncbi:MAG: GGDEF-domain containing protein [Deltaproteobacteria bacterium]|nr:MAG: GGDEF-domain containing protein [Deltaproteobacteria bacterium]
MTLYKKLTIFIIGIFVSLFMVLFLENLHSARSFLTRQLFSNSQNTATSLALSLSPVLAEGDLASAEIMMDAVFNRGYFRSIVLQDVEGKTIASRSLSVEIKEVPCWFVRLIPMHTSEAESLLMSGWRQIGKIYVAGHPGYAYISLWQTMIKIGICFLISALVVIGVGITGIGYLLKPLKRLKEQADAICRKEYIVQEELPKTKELRQIVSSMNHMTTRLRDMFAEQAKIAEKLRGSIYTDQLTGLGNRRFMTREVESHLQHVGRETTGALILLQIADLKEINIKAGLNAGDQLLKKAAEIIKNTVRRINKVALARLNGGDFAVFLPETSAEDAEEITKEISRAMTSLSTEDTNYPDNISHAGCVIYEERPTIEQLLTEADSAMYNARMAGPNMTFFTVWNPRGNRQTKGKFWWKETLEQTMQNGDVLLYGQPVVSKISRSQIIHQEILARIDLGNGEIISAGVFIPFAERMKLVSTFDRMVVKRIVDMSMQNALTGCLAVNISPSSAADTEFIGWLLGCLRQLKNKKSKIIFEMPEFGAVQNLEAIKKFSAKIREIGHGLALDHFGQSFSNFGYLKNLRPEYVKIDQAFTKGLECDYGDSEFFIEALCGVAHSLDIKVIAEGVETDEQAELLQKMSIDALQGYLFGSPERLAGS